MVVAESFLRRSPDRRTLRNPDGVIQLPDARSRVVVPAECKVVCCIHPGTPVKDAPGWWNHLPAL